MHSDMVSQTSSLVSNKRQLVLQLLLTTLSGEELVIVWAMYGSFMRKTFWPMPNTRPSSTPDTGKGLPVRWPKKAHPGALSEAGQERTPWLTRWARATFEQGCLSVLPHFCTSGGAVCAGFAQVTLVELRASYKQGCKSNRNNKQQTQTKQPKKPNKKPPGQPLK